MSQKTFMLESNNVSGKLFTDRARKQSRIGKNYVEETNSQWNTTISQGGIQINPGDTISISSTQINLRGEPDQCLEFSGSTNSTFKESIMDNKASAEFGYYITNRQQYNMNLPLAGHRITPPEDWFSRSYSMPAVLQSDHEWTDFSKSYPYVALEGCARRHCSTPFGATDTYSGSSEGITMTFWDLVSTTTQTQETEYGQQGMYYAGGNTNTPVANSNFEIATPNETRMYICNDNYQGTMPADIEPATYHGPNKYSATLLTQTIDFDVQEGFTTPTALGSDLTTVFHQRTGDADNWNTRDVPAEVYVHNAIWQNNSLKPTIPLGVVGDEGLGYYYDWYTNINPSIVDANKFKLFKIPVSDITDKSYITVRTAAGALLDKIWRDPNVAGSVSKWNTSGGDFGANIPNNTNYKWNGGSGDWGDNYQAALGRDLYYNNLLTGDINRTQSIEVWNSITANSFNQFQITTPTEVGFYKNWILDLEEGLYRLSGSFRGTTVTWPAGSKYATLPPDGPLQQGIFGQQICIMDNYIAVKNVYEDPDYDDNDNGISAISNVDPLKPRYLLEPTNIAADSIQPGTDFQVVPINLIASPLNIALVKKALYRSRELLPDSKANFDQDSENWTEDYVSRIDLGVKDDAMNINANIPAGYSDPRLSANMLSVPSPYIIAQAYKHGYDAETGGEATQPTVKPGGIFGAYNEANVENPPLVSTSGAKFNGLKRLAKDGKQNRQHKNSLYCQTFWNEDCDPKNGKIELPINSQFSFKNGENRMPDYTKYFKPGGTAAAPESTKWEDGNELDLDEGVGLCIVYFNQDRIGNSLLEQPNPDDNSVNLFYTDIPYPSNVGTSSFFPGLSIDENRDMIPMLALVLPKLNTDNNFRGLAYNQRICPFPYIGEICTFSSAFSDGKYAKCCSTQRVNPKFYETINDAVGQTNTSYKEQAYVFDSQYYNIHDYYPYIHVGAIDPQIQFSSTSGRFEISRLHTPATNSSGAWQEPPASGGSVQSSDEIILMNSKRSFMSHVTATSNLKGFATGRLATIDEVKTQSLENINELWRRGLLYTITDGLSIVPWGEMHQDTVRQKTISSQSGIGLLNYLYYQVSSDNTLSSRYVNAFQPQLFNETMFAKMGYSIEQLVPFAGKQNSNFNRSNYNKSLGINQLLIDKQNNMVFPFTTNGYSTAEQSFSTVTNDWVGYDTCYNVNGDPGKEGDVDTATPPGTNAYAFYTVVGSGTPGTNAVGRPNLLFQFDSGDNSTANLKQLPADESLTMFSLGGNSFSNESIATVDSDSLIADNLPSKFNYSYLVIYSDIVGQTSNFITGSNLQITTPAIGYMTRNYSSADFMYSFDSDFNYIADRSFLLNNFNVEIRQPNGKLANIENNSTIIFKIVKNIRPILPVPQPVMKQIVAQNKEEQKELDETIEEFV